jgi:predicted DNA-binding transcriptional regulator YafY
MVETVICQAIQSRHLVQFHYSGNYATGDRIVEPHMVAYNRADNLALSAWYLSGYSESGEGPGWREYLIDEISNVIVLPGVFVGVRPGYKPDGGKTFHNVQCAL